MDEVSNQVELAVREVCWPGEWHAARGDDGLRIEVKNDRVEGIAALVCAFILILAVLSELFFGYGTFDSGMPVAGGRHWVDTLFPPLNYPFRVEAYVEFLFKLLPFILLVFAMWRFFAKTTYHFASNSFVRTQRFAGWSGRKTIVGGKINLNLLYEDKEAPEQTVWSWELELRASRESHHSLLKLVDSSGYLSTARPGEIGRALSRITGWPFEIDLTREDRPKPSDSSSS